MFSIRLSSQVASTSTVASQSRSQENYDPCTPVTPNYFSSYQYKSEEKVEQNSKIQKMNLSKDKAGLEDIDPCYPVTPDYQFSYNTGKPSLNSNPASQGNFSESSKQAVTKYDNHAINQNSVYDIPKKIGNSASNFEKKLISKL